MSELEEVVRSAEAARVALAGLMHRGDMASESEVVDLLGAASDLSRVVDALRVCVTGVVSRRSEGRSRAEALCSRLGFRSTKALVMQAFGVLAPTAETLVSLAQAIGPRTAQSAGELPPFRPALAAALQAGELSADQAMAVHRGLPQPGGVESQPGLTAAAERFLVEGATGGRVAFDERGRSVLARGGSVAGPALDGGQGQGQGQGQGAGAASEHGQLGCEAAGEAGTLQDTAHDTAQGARTGTPPAASPGIDLEANPSGSWWNIPGVTPAGGTTTVGTRSAGAGDVDVWGGRRMEPHLVRIQAAAWRNAIDPDGAAPREGEQIRRRAFAVRRAAGGGWNLSGFAPEIPGAAMAAFLDAHIGPHSHPDRLADPSGRHSGAPVQVGGDAVDTSQDERTPEQKGFDALHSLVEMQHRLQEQTNPGGSGATLLVTVSMETLDRYARSLGECQNGAMLPGLAAWSGARRGEDASRVASRTAHQAPCQSSEQGAGQASGLASGRTSGGAASVQRPARVVTANPAEVEPVSARQPRSAAGLEETLDARFARHSRTDEAVPLSIVATMFCTDGLRLLVTDEVGTAVRLGRQQRPFSRAQRQALAARDRHCRAPGCLAPPAWCHSHHVIPWSRGGPTDLDNAILLCSFHHHELHRGRLGVVPSHEVGATGHPWAVLSSWHLRRLAAERRCGGAAVTASGPPSRRPGAQALGSRPAEVTVRLRCAGELQDERAGAPDTGRPGMGTPDAVRPGGWPRHRGLRGSGHLNTGRPRQPAQRPLGRFAEAAQRVWERGAPSLALEYKSRSVFQTRDR